MTPPLSDTRAGAVPLFRYALLILGVWTCSTSVIWIRLSDTPPALLSGWRLILSALFLAPWTVAAWVRATPGQRRHAVLGTIFPAAALAIHFISWTAGARLTDAARAVLLVNMVPVAMPLVLWLVTRERVNRGEWTGTAWAFAGVLLLSLPGLRFDTGVAVGDWLCIGSMLMITLYFVLGRHNRARGSFMLYLMPVYAWAGIFCLTAALPFHANAMIPPLPEWRWLLALAVVPTIFGHGLLNLSLRHIGAQQVSVWNQGQFVFAAIMAFLVFHEIPGMLFYPGAALILFGSLLTTRVLPR